MPAPLSDSAHFYLRHSGNPHGIRETPSARHPATMQPRSAAAMQRVHSAPPGSCQKRTLPHSTDPCERGRNLPVRRPIFGTNRRINREKRPIFSRRSPPSKRFFAPHIRIFAPQTVIYALILSRLPHFFVCFGRMGDLCHRSSVCEYRNFKLARIARADKFNKRSLRQTVYRHRRSAKFH